MARKYKKQRKVEPKTLRELRVSFDDPLGGEPVLTGDIHKELLGKRSKLGGLPDWIEYDLTPSCSACGSVMSFVGQLDSIDHLGHCNPETYCEALDAQEYMFADVGLIYVFYCFQCLEAKAVTDCY
jgi:hypothetical protein